MPLIGKVLVKKTLLLVTLSQPQRLLQMLVACFRNTSKCSRHSEIATNAVGAAQLQASAVTAVADNSITSAAIAENQVAASEILSGAVDTIHLAAGAVTSAKVGANAVTSTLISRKFSRFRTNSNKCNHNFNDCR